MVVKLIWVVGNSYVSHDGASTGNTENAEKQKHILNRWALKSHLKDQCILKLTQIFSKVDSLKGGWVSILLSSVSRVFFWIFKKKHNWAKAKQKTNSFLNITVNFYSSKITNSVHAQHPDKSFSYHIAKLQSYKMRHWRVNYHKSVAIN